MAEEAEVAEIAEVAEVAEVAEIAEIAEVEETRDRKADFDAARALAETQPDEALEKIAVYTNDPELEFSVAEMETINIAVCEKVTSSSFEDKKAASNACIEVLQGIKLVKDSTWLNMYSEALYDVFSKMSRCAREEERELVWNQLKEIFYEVTLAAKKVWRDKNAPDRLSIYVSLAKLCKSYLDVADEDSIKMCDTEAKEAKFVGKGVLDDDDWKDAKKSIELINKTISDTIHERGLLNDSDDDDY